MYCKLLILVFRVFDGQLRRRLTGKLNMESVREFMRRFWSDESAVSSVEYALLLAFVAAGITFAASEIGGAVEDEMKDVAKCMSKKHKYHGHCS